jgi:hypothetical protein
VIWFAPLLVVQLGRSHCLIAAGMWRHAHPTKTSLFGRL